MFNIFSCNLFFHRKSHTNVVSVPSHFQHQAIFVLTCTFTVALGLSNVTFAREDLASKQISRITSSCIQVSIIFSFILFINLHLCAFSNKFESILTENRAKKLIQKKKSSSIENVAVANRLDREKFIINNRFHEHDRNLIFYSLTSPSLSLPFMLLLIANLFILRVE